MYRSSDFIGQAPGVEYPFENYFIPGPNPAPNLQTTEYMNPARAHAPAARVKPWFEKDGAGSDTNIQRVPQVPYEVQQLPPAPVAVVVGGYETPMLVYKHGWSQHFVPEPGRRPALRAQTPLLQVSRPIKSYSKVNGVSQPKTKLYKMKAPKAKD